MDLLTIFLIAVGLAMDAFAVSISNGLLLNKINFISAFKFGFYFGSFQFIMPIAGWFAAREFSNQIKAFDHWVAFILLVIIGGKMFFETFNGEESLNIRSEKNILSASNLTVLAIATSIDALAVGVSFALTDTNIFYSSIIIGLVAFTLSFIGVLLGKKIGSLFKKNAERLGGLILIVIGVKILLEHLLI